MQKLATRGLTLLLGTAALLTALAALAAGPSYGAAGGMSAPQRVVEDRPEPKPRQDGARRPSGEDALHAERRDAREIHLHDEVLPVAVDAARRRPRHDAGRRKAARHVRRPDGRTQVTYRGRPLYTFTEDTKPGDVKGNGFKDVGTWLAATTNGTATATATPPSGGGYRYPRS